MMGSNSPNRSDPLHRCRPRLAAALALAALLALAACNGDDITSLPESKGLCNGGTGSPVTLNYASRSWWDETGFHQVGSSGYFLAGWLAGSGYSTVRGFAEFNLSTVAGCVSSAALLVQPESNFGGNPVESFSLWQVNTDPATLNGDWTVSLNPAAYADLGDGPGYGSFNVDTVGGLGTPITVPLSNAALVDINQRLGGSFVVGLRADSLTKPVGLDEWVRFGAGGGATLTQLLLQVVP